MHIMKVEKVKKPKKVKPSVSLDPDVYERTLKWAIKAERDFSPYVNLVLKRNADRLDMLEEKRKTEADEK